MNLNDPIQARLQAQQDDPVMRRLQSRETDLEDPVEKRLKERGLLANNSAAPVAETRKRTLTDDLASATYNGINAGAAVARDVFFNVADWVSKFTRKADEESFKLREVMKGTGSFVKDSTTGRYMITNPTLDSFRNAKTEEEKRKIIQKSEMDTPLMRALNSDAAQVVTGGIYEGTSNIPLKVIARIKSIGDKTYDEAYKALLAKSKDPNNTQFEKIVYGLQDSGIQSAIGALLSVGTAVLTKSPNAAKAVAGTFFAGVSAEAQRREKGQITSTGNIAIDTIGDTIISGFAQRTLDVFLKESTKAGFKALLANMGRGFAIEGTTEPTQTFFKYANDYVNAATEEERNSIVREVTDYVKNGGMVNEFLVGGLSGALITGGAAGLGKVGQGKISTSVDPNIIPTKQTSVKELEEKKEVLETKKTVLESELAAPAESKSSPIVEGTTPTVPLAAETSGDAAVTATKIAEISSQIEKINMDLAEIAAEEAAETEANQEAAIRELTLKPSTAVTEEEQVAEIDKFFGEKGVTEKVQEVKKRDGTKVVRIAEPLVTKNKIRQIFDDVPEFKENPVLTVNDNMELAWKGESQSFNIKAEALGLQPANLKVGDSIRVNPITLKGKVKQMRVFKGEESVASLATDLADGTVKPAMTVEGFKQRIEQLNKFGQSQAILRRTGGLPKSAAGMFQYVKPGNENKKGLPANGIVKVQNDVVEDSQSYMSTLAHELGHALEFALTGATNKDTFRVFGRDLDAETKVKIRNELKAVTNEMVGEEKAKAGAGYYYQNTELLARFLQRMFDAQPNERVGTLGTLSEIAPTALDYIERSAVETPIVAEYLEAVRGTIDKGERKTIFLRDMKQTYQKILGKRVGTMAWNDEMRYRAMKERAKISIENLIKRKFKKVKDDPKLLFQAVESIKVTTNDNVEYGTRDFKYAKTDEEAALMIAAGYSPIIDDEGNHINEVVDGVEYPRFAKTRYTPDQAKIIFEQLSPEGQQLVKDFTATRDEAKDLFNREIIKDVYKINSNLEGWVHRYWDEKGDGMGKDKLKTKRAAATKFRSGAEGYVEDLQKAMTKALTELETTKAYNAFIQDYFARVSKPIAKDAKPDKDWIEVQGNVLKGGIARPQDSRTVIVKDGKSYVAEQPRYQMPAVIYKRFQAISDVAVEAGNFTRIMNSVNRYWRVNILFHPGSAATNFISGGIQYSSKVLTDFYTEILTGNVTFEKTRRNMASMFTVLLPKGWHAAPDWIYGGDISNSYGQFQGDSSPGIKKLDDSVDYYADKALALYGFVERYWKKVIATSENAGDLEKLNTIGKDGLKLPDAEEKAMLDAINEEIDLFAYDYENVPVWMQNYQQNPFLQAVKPFAKYPYKYSKHVTEMITSVFDQTLPWQERAAKIMALGTLVALYAYIREERRKKQTTPEVDETAPTQVSTRGRLFIGSDDKGNEKFIRVAKYPFINLTEAAGQIIDGNTNTGIQSIADMMGSVAPTGDVLLALMGYSNQFQQFTPTPVRLGDAAASFIPGTRILQDIARFFDPYQRRKETFGQSFTSLLPIPVDNEDLRIKLRGEARTIQVPLEGGVRRQPGEKTTRTTTDMLVENYKWDIGLGLLSGVYTTRINPVDAEAFVERRAENDREKEKRERKEAARKK